MFGELNERAVSFDEVRYSVCSRSGWIYSNVFKEMWYSTVSMGSETVELSVILIFG